MTDHAYVCHWLVFPGQNGGFSPVWRQSSCMPNCITESISSCGLIPRFNWFNEMKEVSPFCSLLKAFSRCEHSSCRYTCAWLFLLGEVQACEIRWRFVEGDNEQSAILQEEHRAVKCRTAILYLILITPCCFFFNTVLWSTFPQWQLWVECLFCSWSKKAITQLYAALRKRMSEHLWDLSKLSDFFSFINKYFLTNVQCRHRCATEY